jgi:CBS domain-containing membrane protein
VADGEDAAAAASGVGEWLRRFLPDGAAVPAREVWLAAGAAAAGVLIVLAASSWLLATPPVAVAAVGASAVLMFGLPASPLAQPWTVLGGYLVCAAAGEAAAHWIPGVELAAAVAVGLALLAMIGLRCLHPPGGAVALIPVFGGDAVVQAGWGYLWHPVLTNALLLIASALVINSLLPGRHYPRRPAPAHVHTDRFDQDDLRAALHDYGHALAASEEELEAIIELAEQHAKKRRR